MTGPRESPIPRPSSFRNAPDANAVERALDRCRAEATTLRDTPIDGVTFLIDECLSPILCQVATEFGYPAFAIRDLGWTGLKDGQLRRRMIDKGYTLVTNNRADWLGLLADDDVHPGLVVLARQAPRPEQIIDFARALVATAAVADLVNTVIEVATNGTVTSYDLPSPE